MYHALNITRASKKHAINASLSENPSGESIGDTCPHLRLENKRPIQHSLVSLSKEQKRARPTNHITCPWWASCAEGTSTLLLLAHDFSRRPSHPFNTCAEYRRTSYSQEAHPRNMQHPQQRHPKNQSYSPTFAVNIKEATNITANPASSTM